jgi:aminoglycoside phosphotransferase (APT) family kinase protein
LSTNNRNKFLSSLDLGEIKSGLRSGLSNLSSLDSLKLLRDGFSSYVVLIGDEIILRIAKTAESMQGHRKEWSVLLYLQGYLPLQVPNPEWQIGPSETFPFGAIGYRAIAGLPFSLELAPAVNLKYIAKDLARSFVALHSFPLDVALSFGITESDDLESLGEEVMPVLSTHFSKDDYKKFISWWEKFRNRAATDNPSPKLIHGDPWAENIILNEKLDHLVGIIDFESVTIGDVAQDFAAQKYLGRDFLSQVIQYYSEFGGDLGSQFLGRLQDHSMLRELRGLRYAIRYPESGELEDCLGKVRSELLLNA